jgi:RimJ/RimL family protein N-acetyltransferase
MMDPQNYTASETLKDGTPVTIRAIRHDDGNTILDAFKNLDRDSVYRRFFSPKKDLTAAELEQLTEVDFNQVVALVVTAQGRDGDILIGGGRYARDGMGSDSAELAFTTDSNYRGGGIATLILRHLVRIAREAGVSRFEADVLAENQPMLAVFRHSGLPMQLRRDGGVLRVTLSLQSDLRQRT